MRFGSLLLIVWLIIGVAAAGQRGYYDGSIGSCTKVGTIAVTIITGPLNYLGVNPTINCTAPKAQPVAVGRATASGRVEGRDSLVETGHFFVYKITK
jgi:hypothetical protein